MTKEYLLHKNASGMHCFLVDAKTVNRLLKNGNRRVICEINGTEEFHCALLGGKDGKYFVNVGLRICKKLQLREGSKIMATFRTDDSKYQFEMPEEFREVLATDRIADQKFHALTPGSQRGLIYLVARMKSIDKRIEWSLKIAEKLKSGIRSPRDIIKKA